MNLCIFRVDRKSGISAFWPKFKAPILAETLSVLLNPFCPSAEMQSFSRNTLFLLAFWWTFCQNCYQKLGRKSVYHLERGPLGRNSLSWFFLHFCRNWIFLSWPLSACGRKTKNLFRSTASIFCIFLAYVGLTQSICKHKIHQACHGHLEV